MARNVKNVPSDLEIAQAANLRTIEQVASKMGILNDELERHGTWKAKVKLDLIDRLADQPNGKYIDVTAITPTRSEEHTSELQSH